MFVGRANRNAMSKVTSRNLQPRRLPDIESDRLRQGLFDRHVFLRDLDSSSNPPASMPSFRVSLFNGIRDSANRRSAKKSRVQPATCRIFTYIHSATSAKLWIYAY